MTTSPHASVDPHANTSEHPAIDEKAETSTDLPAIRAGVYGEVVEAEPGHQGGLFPAQPGVPLPSLWPAFLGVLLVIGMLATIAIIAICWLNAQP